MSEGTAQNQNAAQIAARKIKAKPSSLRARRPLTPQPSSSFQQSNIQPSSLSGSLFGGSIQAAGAFNFSAPGAPSLSFGSTSNPFESTAEIRDDGRADTSAEENARTKRVQLGPPNGQSSPKGTSAFQSPFVQNRQSNGKVNIFGSTLSSGDLTFGQTNNTNGETHNTNKNTTITFSTGATPQQPHQISPNSTPSTQADNLLKFGDSPSQTSSTSNIFNFASPTTQDKPAEPRPSSDQSSSRPASPTVNVSATVPKNDTTSAMFPPFAGQQSSSNSFGQANTSGNTTFQPSQIASVFNQASDKPTMGMLGNHQVQPATTGMLGNHAVQAPFPPGNHQVQPAATGMLGNHAVQAPFASGNHLFGSHAMQPSTGIGSANQPPQQSQSNIFFTNQASQQQLGGFGRLPDSQPTSSSPFTFNTTFPANNGFNTQFQQPTKSDMSNTFTKSGLFASGNQSIAKPSLTAFGNQSMTNPNPFASLQVQNAPTNNAFGNGSNHAAASKGFSAHSDQSNTSSLFGSDLSKTKAFGTQPGQNATASNAFDSKGQQPGAIKNPGVQSEKRDLFSHATTSSDLGSMVSTGNSLSAISAANFGKPTLQLENSDDNDQNSTINLFGGSGAIALQDQTAFSHLNKAMRQEPFPLKANSASSGNFGVDPTVNTPRDQKDSRGKQSEVGQALTSSTLLPSEYPLDASKITDNLPSSSTFAEAPRHTAANHSQMSNLKTIGDPPTTGLLLPKQLPKSLTDFDCHLSDEAIAAAVKLPETYTLEQRRQFFAAYRWRTLNTVMASLFDRLPFGASVDTAMAFYNGKRQEIINKAPEFLSGIKRKARDAELDDFDESAKRIRSTEQVTPTISILADTTSATHIPLESTHNTTRLDPRTHDPPSFFQESNLDRAPSPQKSKRKAEGDHPDDPNTFKVSKPKSGSDASNTSAAFKGAVNEDQSAPPHKKMKALSSLTASVEQKEPAANPWAKALTDVSPSPGPKIDKPAIRPPTFGSISDGNSANFASQFLQQASKSDEEKERKRMADEKENDMDSDEDEAEWEARYKVKRQAELQQLRDIAAQKKTGFLPQRKSPAASQSLGSFAFGSNSSGTTQASNLTFQKASVSTDLGDSVTTNGVTTKSTSEVSDPTSIFKGTASGAFMNPFNYLEGSKDVDDDSDAYSDDAENKDPKETQGRPASMSLDPFQKRTLERGSNPFSTNGDSHAATTTFGLLNGAVSKLSANTSTSTASRSIFDRISRDNHGNAIRQISVEEKENAQPNNHNAQPVGSGLESTFGRPEDNTWKPESAIKFGSSSAKIAAPTLNFTQATPTKPHPTAFNGLFGNSPNVADAQTRSAFNWIPQSTDQHKASNASSESPFSNNVSFNFGGLNSNPSSLFSSANPSSIQSGASTPGERSVETNYGGEGEGKDGNDPEEIHAQISLVQSRAGEEDESVLYEARAKTQFFDKVNKAWVTKGVGALRLLKNPQTNSSRVIMRADPAGTVVLNKNILKNITFSATGKTVKFMAASDKGEGLETYLIQVKTSQDAQTLADALESSKS